MIPIVRKRSTARGKVFRFDKAEGKMVELEKCICERFQTGETNTDFQCPIHGLEGSKIEASDYRTMGR